MINVLFRKVSNLDVGEDKIENWVRKKLEKGISEEALRNSLKKSGHDPSIVDKVKKKRRSEHKKEKGEESSNLGKVDLSKNVEEQDDGNSPEKEAEGGSNEIKKAGEMDESAGKEDEENSGNEEIAVEHSVEPEIKNDTSRSSEADSESSGNEYKRSLDINMPTVSFKKAFASFGGALNQRKRGIAGVLIIVLLMAAVPFIPVDKVSGKVQSSVQNIDNPLKAPENSEKPAESHESGESVNPSSNMSVVKLRQGDANPASLTVTSGTAVKFVNEQSKSYLVNFERGPADLSLKPGKSSTVEFNMTVYYTATPMESEEPKIYGSVIVE